MMELKKRLKNNPEYIEEILEEYDFYNINVGNKEVRCGIEENTNVTSIRIQLNDKLTANDYARDFYGDLFSLIMNCRNVSLRDIIQKVKVIIGISHVEFNKSKKIFGGFYDNIKKRQENNIELKVYEDDVMIEYINKFNTLFLKDGISLETQKKFNIGVCHLSSRITVPWYNYQGELVGVEGRYLGDYAKDETPKWFPLIPFPKSQVLFGYNVNYKELQNNNDIFIGESSKFTMQLDTMGIPNSVGLGGNAIHSQQIKQLSWLNPRRLIFCFDEGLDEDIIKRQIDKTKIMLKFSDIQVGYVLDKECEILEKDSKCSPSDLGKEKFDELITKYVEWGEVND